MTSNKATSSPAGDTAPEGRATKHELSRIPDDASTLLTAWSEGDGAARDRLLAILYDELRSRARRLLIGERGRHSINATALVHEVYVRLVDECGMGCTNRAHFLAIASAVMRRILVDHARARKRAKRGAGWQSVALDLSEIEGAPRSPDLVELDDAIASLATIDEVQAKIVELRFFGGLTIAETAQRLGISPSTTKREWQMARAWLWRRLQADATAAQS
jgi:RNA polymerase sigma-70 factor, ECF subfamily